ISCAASAVTKRTPATTRIRSSSMAVYSTKPRLFRSESGAGLQRQRLAPGEALFDSVPEGDLVLTDLPAEKHVLVAAASGEVDETAIEILDQDAELLDPADELGDLGRFPSRFLIEGRELPRVDPAPVPGDNASELCAPSCRLA